MKTFGFLRTSVLVLGVLAMGLCGCRKDPVTGPDDNKEDLAAKYEVECRKMNTNTASLKAAVAALDNKDYVTGTEALTKSQAPASDEGFIISFAEAEPVKIYTDVAPLVAIELDNGSYWWTLNGEFILDGEDNKMAVAEVTPQLKIKDAKWLLSCDSGKNWTEIEPYSGDEKMNVTEDDDNVYVEFNGQTLTLSKTPPAAPELTFTFNFTEITATSITFDIDASDDEMRYLVMCVEKAYGDQFADDEALYQDDIAYFNMHLDYGYENLETVISEYTNVGDATSLVMPGMDPETEYMFYAYGLELDGTRTSAIHREYVSTTAIEKTDVTFEIDTYVDGCNIDVVVTPSDNNVLYYFDGIEKASVDIDFGGDIAAAAQYFIDYNVQMGSYYGMTSEEVILEIASQGPDQYIFECAPNTEFIIFAMAVGTDGTVISDVASKNVVTGDIVPSDNVITLNVDATTSTTVTVSTTTTSEDPYFLGIEPAYKFEGMTDDEIIETVIYEYGDYISWATESGDVNGLVLEMLEPNTEYLLMAFGVQGVNPTTSLVKQLVKTVEGNSPYLCEFDITVDGISETSAAIVVTPSFDDVRYYWELGPSEVTDEEYISYFEGDINMFIEFGEVANAIEFWQYMGYTGVDSWEYTDLQPGTSYDVVVFPIDMSTGEMITPFIRKSFTTLGTAPAAAKAAPMKMRKAELQSRSAEAVTHRAGVKAPVQEEVAPMRKIDVQNATKVPAKKTVRRSAFIQK